jgi:FkbH-like protein
MNTAHAIELLRASSCEVWAEIARQARATEDASDLLLLAGLRRKAHAIPRVSGQALRIAFLGGYSFQPFVHMVEVRLEAHDVVAATFVGGFDNYVSEIMDGAAELAAFRPDVVFFAPSHTRCSYEGTIADPVAQQRESASRTARQILDLCVLLNERTGAEIVLANFPLPSGHDFGGFRARTLATDWGYRKWVNLELGLSAPPCVRICDLEFLAARMGGLLAQDPGAWFESKQLGSPALLGALAGEVGRLVASLRRSMRKVLVLDLDNTLWGGVIGDDGVEGIELGDTSPRGEAFKAFQRYVRSLKQRGVLLAVCSKNDHERAVEPFERHPEMVLRMEDFVAFKANWEPKSENIKAIAVELNLGLDSLVFVDDNPAEIEIVRQFAPEVEAILVGPDPAAYVAQLQDAHVFEPQRITEEDVLRSEQYRAEARRREAGAATTDMDSYLSSLEMSATIREFVAIDFPRIAQLIARSNQFNLTTRRRTEAEVAAIAAEPSKVCFTVRLADRFGDHGLIAVVVAECHAGFFEVDTWLMSCRVLKRQVEELVVNEMVRLASLRECTAVRGRYVASPKNGMVKDLYPRMGFQPTLETAEELRFALETKTFHPFRTHINVLSKAYEPSERP